MDRSISVIPSSGDPGVASLAAARGASSRDGDGGRALASLDSSNGDSGALVGSPPESKSPMSMTPGTASEYAGGGPSGGGASDPSSGGRGCCCCCGCDAFLFTGDRNLFSPFAGVAPAPPELRIDFALSAAAFAFLDAASAAAAAAALAFANILAEARAAM